MRKTLSLDLRERILAAYDADEGTREEVAWRFRVSLGMVKKLLQQRRQIGEVGPQHHRSGRKPQLVESHRKDLRALLAKQPDLTLAQMRDALTLKCSLPAIHYVLAALGLTYKKRRSARPSKPAPTSSRRGASGLSGRADSIRRSSSSSTSPRPRRT